jgi:hypothetical protein
MFGKKSILYYLLLLLAHLAHLFEEIWGQFFMIEILGGLGYFLVVNWVLYATAVFIFFLIVQRIRIGYTLGIVYAAIMILNGLGHNVLTLATGNYYGGFAGGFTGLLFIIIGPLLIRNLLIERQGPK